MIPSKCSKLITHIREIISAGFVLDRDTLHFINSTWFVSNEDDMENLFKGKGIEDSERDMLLELIVFPDEKLQAGVERFLEKHPFSTEDESLIIFEFAGKDTLSAFIIEDSRVFNDILLPAHIVTKFIQRLNITKNPDPVVLETIDKLETERDRYLARVKLRNARFEFTENNKSFLISFFTKFPAEHPLFYSCQEFLYEFFCEINDDGNLLESFRSKIEFYRYHKQKKENLDKLIQKNNVETLMLSGNRISGISVMEADEKIHIIRSIILYIYNIIIDIYHESPLFTLDAFSENQEFDSIMNTLKFKES